MPRAPQPLMDEDRRGVVRFEPTPKGLAITLLAAALAWVALQLVTVLLVLVVALFLAGTLSPAIEWLEKKGWKRGRAIALVFGVMFVGATLMLALTIPSLIDQVMTVAKEEPALRARLVKMLAHSRVTAPLAESLRKFEYGSLASAFGERAFAYSSRIVEVVAYLVSAVFLSLYILIDRDRLRGGLFAVVPRTHHIRLSRVLLNLEIIVGGYIRGQALTSALMAVFTFILLMSCGVHNALAIAVIAGLADVLPYIGVFLSVGPALVAALSRGPVVVGIVLVAMLAYEELESRFLVPRIYGNVLRLPSSIVLLALLAGGALGGIVGALLALPVAAAMRMLVEELRVALPGAGPVDDGLLARDERAEEEYERRAEGISAEKAAAIAVEIAEDRQDEEGGGEKAADVPITSGKR